jgi:hypothetical protein
VGTFGRARQYLALLRHRRAFVAGLVLLLALACGFQVVAYTSLAGHLPESVRHLAGGLGDALIIAAVLALLVDPVMQHRFLTEWGRDLYWSIFSPDSPGEFRDAIQGLAGPRG